MQQDSKSDNSKLLIDFNSPVSKNSIQKPLIPLPSVSNQLASSPTNNNPFDVVAKQTNSPEAIDPFECVLKNAFYNLNESDQNSLQSEVNNKSSISGSTELKEDCDNGNISSIPHKEPTKISQENVKRLDNLEISNIKNEDVEVSPNIFICENLSAIKQSASQFVPDGDNQSQISVDLSTEEGLKAVIAKRVNKCIQKALNDSIKSKFNKSNDNLKFNGENVGEKIMLNKRSLSFITSSSNHVKLERLNKSCTEYSLQNDSFNVEAHELRTPDSSTESSHVKLLTSESAEVSKMEDSVFEVSGKEQVFVEANRLARTFSKIANSFCKNSGSDDEEDLMSCKPRWLHADSSEDEEEKLRNDPALNIRVSLPNSTVQTPPDSLALSAFKQNQRRSLSHLHDDSTQDELDIRRCYSIGCNPVTVPIVPKIVKPVPVVFVEPTEKAIKLKKTVVAACKKGPMRAVVPVQSMTKESVQNEDKRRIYRDGSPVRKSNPIYVMETPNKDDSQLSMRPVASSTPNKSLNGMSHLLAPAIEISSNKRRSLGSTLESRISRPLAADEGARLRSNSASSSIPTSLMSVNALKAVPALKTKSSSNLQRVSSTNTQASGQPESKAEKKTSKQVKTNFNPRALNEVKTKSLRTGPVKNAVKALSNLVMGKGKKVARDKENRVPV